MSIIKLLSCFTSARDSNFKKNESPSPEEGERLHAKTYGISSDPIAHFALAFAALIHDVDHPGVPNRTLVKEKSRLARVFNDRSVAEQNSFQCAWDLLQDPSFDKLREVIFTTKEEREHFRQLVINSIVATDLMDKELNDDRAKRWELAFSQKAERSSSGTEVAPESSVASQRELQDRQATLLLEYLIQASDVAHTMQHWNVYRKWNERLFYEAFKAFNSGRLDENPCNFWYEAELDFFDNTVIPMAQKLKSSGAFGIFFDEHLSYATQNRHEWQRKGKEIVCEMEGAFEALGIGGFSERGDLSEFDASGRDVFTSSDH